MSHKGNDIFRDSVREAKVERMYEQAELPARCFTPFNIKDGDEITWRTEHCWKERQSTSRVAPAVTLPKSDDEDYWMEREAQAQHLRDIYAEAREYRNL